MVCSFTCTWRQYLASLLIQYAAALLAHALAGLAFGAGLAADVGGSALGADNHEIRDLDGRFVLGDAALDLALGIGAGVALDHHHRLDQRAALGGIGAQHLALLALVAPGDDLYQI